MDAGGEPRKLGALLEGLRPKPGEDWLSVGDMLDRVGRRSFMAAVLVPALILVSPLSAIPGSPTVGMLLIVAVTVQAVLGRRQLWLPGFVTRRRVRASRLDKALDWLAGPVAWVDRHTRNRLRLLTQPPLDRIPLLLILCLALPWPVLEPLPMVTSIGAFAVSLLAVGLMLKDGLFVVLGYAFTGLLALGLLALWHELV
ncbi:exopolysaccharide biosynthesis protein [Thetidibacter halocola]|uniref:Exopolysaccharide biosynthesis protein n=1 Tax=Thetidibacter halocola TaxID=2827239 RepID=A0A8J7WGL3_9RHOB|nr:exopolysaccharide biosynthesis protein [Thetidibacter halocola]MBS0126074.1 exopolysaccharide biosynthesis protein [Thetidibacter halocola]